MDKEELKKIYESTNERIESISFDTDEEDENSFNCFLEGILDISRKQSLVRGEWVTDHFDLLIACGGPNITVSTNGYIDISWWSQPYENIVSPAAKENLQQIEDWLLDIYPDN